jgi:hypothetical protein
VRVRVADALKDAVRGQKAQHAIERAGMRARPAVASPAPESKPRISTSHRADRMS